MIAIGQWSAHQAVAITASSPVQWSTWNPRSSGDDACSRLDSEFFFLDSSRAAVHGFSAPENS